MVRLPPVSEKVPVYPPDVEVLMVIEEMVATLESMLQVVAWLPSKVTPLPETGELVQAPPEEVVPQLLALHLAPLPEPFPCQKSMPVVGQAAAHARPGAASASNPTTAAKNKRLGDVVEFFTFGLCVPKEKLKNSTTSPAPSQTAFQPNDVPTERRSHERRFPFRPMHGCNGGKDRLQVIY